jgi:hypothetical protein
VLPWCCPATRIGWFAVPAETFTVASFVAEVQSSDIGNYRGTKNPLASEIAITCTVCALYGQVG